MEAKFEYFIDQTNKKLDEIDRKVDRLITFRVLLIGAAIGMSGFTSFVISVLTLYLSK